MRRSLPVDPKHARARGLLVGKVGIQQHSIRSVRKGPGDLIEIETLVS